MQGLLSAIILYWNQNITKSSVLKCHGILKSNQSVITEKYFIWPTTYQQILL